MDHRKHPPGRIVRTLKSPSGLRCLVAAGILAASLPAAAVDVQPAPRLISVSGDGDVSVVPDRASLQLGITALNADVATAQSAVNKVVKAYVAEARRLGSHDDEVSTSSISIAPEYAWDDKARANHLTGYRASREIVVHVTDLNHLGDYLLAATAAGVNQVQPPQLESSKAADLQNQALVMAAKKAQAKARLIADTLGVKLGVVFALSEEGDPVVRQPRMMMAMRAKAEAPPSGNDEMGLETGEIHYHAQVSAQFEVSP